jgi:sugar phosphate isomerase/epimerase
VSTPPLSLQLYSVRDAAAADLDGTLGRIAEIGFRTVEMYGFEPKADEYADLLRKHGLSPSSAHSRLLSDDPVAILTAARVVGAPFVIEPAADPARWADRAGIDAIARDLNERATIAADFGIRVGYHNHWWEFGEVDGLPGLELLAALLDPAVVLEVDTYWAQVAGVDAVALLSRLGDRVQLIHVKDGPITREGQDQLAIGDGAMPVLDILAGSTHCVPVVEFDGFRGDVFDAVRRSFAFLTANGRHA